jgi:hypothetical protein
LGIGLFLCRRGCKREMVGAFTPMVGKIKIFSQVRTIV